MASIVIPVDAILRKWHPTIRKRVNPKEVYQNIRGLTDFDRNIIERALDREGPQIAADRMIEAIRRRDQRSGFLSFIAALYEHNYEDLANEILVSSQLHNVQAIQNAITEERARIVNPPSPFEVATASIAPMSVITPTHNPQLHNTPFTYHDPHQVRMQNMNMDQHIASGLQHQTNQHAQLGHARNWQNNFNPVSQSQHLGTQVPHQNPGNHGNQYSGHQVTYNSNQAPQNGANRQVMMPASPQQLMLASQQQSMPAACNVSASLQQSMPAPCNVSASQQQLMPPTCNVPASPHQSCNDPTLSNTQTIQQSYTSTSDKDIDEMPNDEFEKLVENLNEEQEPGWKKLASTFKISRRKVKEFSNSKNPAEDLLDYLRDEKKIGIRQLKSHLQKAGLDRACSCIQCEDLPEDNGNHGSQMDVPPDGTQVLYSRVPVSGVPSMDQGSSIVSNQNINTMDGRSHSTMTAADNQSQTNTDLDTNSTGSENSSLDRNNPGSVNTSVDSSENSSSNRSSHGSANTSSDINSSGSVNTSSDINSSGSANTSSDINSPGSVNTSSDRNSPGSAGSVNTSSDRNSPGSAGSFNTSLDRNSPGLVNANNIPVESADNRFSNQNSVENNSLPSENDVFNNLDRQKKEDVPDKIVKIGNQPAAKSDSISMENTQEVLEAGKSMGNGDIPSVDDLQHLQTYQVPPETNSNMKVEAKTTGFSEVKGNTNRPSTQRANTSGSLASEQAVSFTSLMEDAGPKSPNRSLEQQKSTGIDAGEETDSTEFGIQVTSFGGNTDNPNIPSPLTSALTGYNTEKQGTEKQGTEKQGTEKQDTKKQDEAFSGGDNGVQKKSADQEVMDDQVRGPVQATSLGFRTDNPNMPNPLTKALSENNKGDQNGTTSLKPGIEANTSKKKKEWTFKPDCDDVTMATTDQERPDYPVRVTSLGGQTDNQHNAAELTKVLSENSERVQSGTPSLDTDTTEEKNFASGLNAARRNEVESRTGITQTPETDPNNKQYDRNLTQETSEQPLNRNYRDVHNSIPGSRQSEEQSGSGTVSDLLAVDVRPSENRLLVPLPSSISGNAESGVFRDLQNSIPRGTQSDEQSISGAVSTLPALDTRSSENQLMTSPPPSISRNADSGVFRDIQNSIPRGTLSAEQSISGAVSNFSALDTRSLENQLMPSPPCSVSENVESGVFRDLQNSIPRGTESAEQSISGTVSNLSAIELRQSESVLLISPPGSMSDQSSEDETTPKELYC